MYDIFFLCFLSLSLILSVICSTPLYRILFLSCIQARAREAPTGIFLSPTPERVKSFSSEYTICCSLCCSLCCSVCMCLRLCVHVYVFVSACVWVCLHVCACVCVCVCMCVGVFQWEHNLFFSFAFLPSLSHALSLSLYLLHSHIFALSRLLACTLALSLLRSFSQLLTPHLLAFSHKQTHTHSYTHDFIVLSVLLSFGS